MNDGRLAEIRLDLERGGDAAQWPTAAILELIEEVETLSHLHALDHSLADQWQADNERLRALLKALEWRGARWEDAACPDCNAWEDSGVHESNCQLAKEILAPTREQA